MANPLAWSRIAAARPPKPLADDDRQAPRAGRRWGMGHASTIPLSDQGVDHRPRSGSPRIRGTDVATTGTSRSGRRTGVAGGVRAAIRGGRRRPRDGPRRAGPGKPRWRHCRGSGPGAAVAGRAPDRLVQGLFQAPPGRDRPAAGRRPGGRRSACRRRGRGGRRSRGRRRGRRGRSGPGTRSRGGRRTGRGPGSPGETNRPSGRAQDQRARTRCIGRSCGGTTRRPVPRSDARAGSRHRGHRAPRPIRSRRACRRPGD